ncbi:MAG: O-antigen ligase family protein [Bacteroidales bacterium]|nr:O-antigen ligase family protein [Bacteroidales bacterium]
MKDFFLPAEGKPKIIFFISFLLLLLLTFLIPVYKKVVPHAMALLTLSFLVSLFWETGFIKKFRRPLIIMSLSYFFYLIATSFSEHKDIAGIDLLLKLPMFLLPFVFSSLSLFLKGRHIKTILLVFVISCFLTSLFLVLRASLLFAQSGKSEAFMYDKLSFLFHPSYYAMYINFALAVVLHYFTLYYSRLTKLKVFMYLSLMLYFVIIILLLNSKAVFISTLLIILIWLLVFIKTHKAYKFGLFFLFFSIFLIVTSLKLTPQLYDRLFLALKNVKPEKGKVNSWDGTYIRTQIWDCSVGIIKKNFWTGVGTGDVKDELVKSYVAKQLHVIKEKKLNAHNQFLQTFIATGIGGFLSLLIYLLAPLYYSFRGDFKWLSLFLVLIICVNFLFEAMLETQAGVAFTAFFTTFFVFFKPTSLSQ